MPSTLGAILVSLPAANTTTLPYSSLSLQSALMTLSWPAMTT